MRLDHVTLTVEDYESSVPLLAGGLGFEVTTTGRDARHGRVFLDRGYVELAGTPDPPPVPIPDDRSWRFSGFFLRSGRLEDHARLLREHGLPVEGPTEYRGQDGVWLDLAFGAPLPEPVSPIFVERITPREVAADWPPALRHPHPNGSRTLKSVYLVTEQLETAFSFYRCLLAAETSSRPEMTTVSNHLFGTREIRLGLGGRQSIVLAEPASENGPAGRWIESYGPGVFGAVFGTGSISAVARRLEALHLAHFRNDAGELWATLPDDRGARFGFVGP